MNYYRCDAGWIPPEYDEGYLIVPGYQLAWTVKAETRGKARAEFIDQVQNQLGINLAWTDSISIQKLG